MRLPFRVESSRARSKAAAIIRDSGIEAPAVSAKAVLKNYARLFYFDGICEESLFDAGWCHFDDYEYKVYMNRNLQGGRDNFAYAHELGHIVLDHFVSYDVNALNDKQLMILNREADIFATNLLMPEQFIFEYVTMPLTVQYIGYLKDLFDVSWKAFITRLNELQICSVTETEDIFSRWKCKKSTKERDISANPTYLWK